MCSISRDPRHEEYTICIALARDPVVTVRANASPYGQGYSGAQLQLARTENQQVRVLSERPTRCQLGWFWPRANG